MVKVYTKPDCVQCHQTTRFLTRVGIKFEELNLLDYPDQVQVFLDLGFKSAPIVQTDNDIWSGFKIDKLNKLAEESL